MKCSANITLFVNEFDAKNLQHAESKINAYIDKISEVVDSEIFWDDCDFDIFNSE